MDLLIKHVILAVFSENLLQQKVVNTLFFLLRSFYACLFVRVLVALCDHCPKQGAGDLTIMARSN